MKNLIFFFLVIAGSFTQPTDFTGIEAKAINKTRIVTQTIVLGISEFLDLNNAPPKTWNVVYPNNNDVEVSQKKGFFKKLKSKVKNLKEKIDANAKAAAIVAYLFPLAFLIALVFFHEKGNDYSAFHLRQALGIHLSGIVLFLLGILIFYFAFITDGTLLFFLFVGVLIVFSIWFVAWLASIIKAITGSKKPVFFLGKQFQKWFSGIE
jgi:hypothetical protein